MFKRILNNDAFVTKNSEEIVEKYGRKTIIICQGEIFTGLKALEKAEKKYPGITPMIFSVPPKKMFTGGFLL